MMDPEIPKNEGFFDSLELVVPSGCVLNPAAGKPVSAGTHHPGADIGEVIAVAMQHVLPDKAVPQTYKTGIPTIIRGVDPRSGGLAGQGPIGLHDGPAHEADDRQRHHRGDRQLGMEGLRQVRVARLGQHDGEQDQDADGAEVDEDLGRGHDRRAE